MKYFTKIIIIILFSSALLNAEVFKVGVIAPLSGPVAEYGVATRNGIELAVSSNPKAFGNIEFVYEDSQYDTKVSLSAYRKLRQDANIKVIYNFGMNSSLALLPIVENDCFPIVGVDFPADSAVGSHCVVSFNTAINQLGKATIDYIRSLGAKKIAIVKNENTYINDLTRGMLWSSKDSSQPTIIASVGYDEFNFRPIITKLKSKDYDWLGVLLLPGQFSAFLQQMKQLNYNVKIFGSDTLASKSEVAKSGSLVDNAIYANFSETSKFNQDYLNKFKNDFQIPYAALAHDFANLTAKLFNDAKPDISISEVINKFKTSGKHNGALGEFYYADSPTDGPRYRFPIYIKQIKGQNSVVLQ